MFRRITLTLSLAALAAIAAACGSDNATPSPTASATGTAATSGTAAPSASAAPAAASIRLFPRPSTELGAPAVPEAKPATAASAVPYLPTVKPYANYGTTAKPGEFPRTVKHAMGEVKLETAPKRVVVLDTGEMDAIVELGLKPVGAIDWTGAGFAPYLKDSMQGVEVVGSIQEPNLEKIAALKPDMILTNKLRHEKLYQQLSAIAPTVYGERAGLVWRENFQLYAQALGLEERGSQVIANYEDHVKKFNAAFKDKRPTVSIVRVTATNLRYYQRASFTSQVLTDLGFPRTEAQNIDDFAMNNMALETLGQYAPGDLIIVSVVPGAEKFAEQMKASPLWQGLDAVKKGNVLNVDDTAWIAGLGYRSANQIIDDVAKHFKLTL